MASLAIAAAITAALPALPASPPQLPDADPALWVVNDHDTTIYLFGTFHALDGRSAWFNDEIATAFTASDELILEVVASPGAPRPTDGPAPAESAVTPSASFLASTRMVMSAGRSQGMQVAHGADMVLRRVAEDLGKPVGGLETVDFQLGMFRRIPAAKSAYGNPEQKRAVMTALSQVMTEMQGAWNRGESGLFTAMLEQMHATSPQNYRLLFVDRNTHWADWIANRLNKPGTVFVAVGAGHLAGYDSVQNKLAALGVRSARVN